MTIVNTIADGIGIVLFSFIMTVTGMLLLGI